MPAAYLGKFFRPASILRREGAGVLATSIQNSLRNSTSSFSDSCKNLSSPLFFRRGMAQV